MTRSHQFDSCQGQSKACDQVSLTSKNHAKQYSNWRFSIKQMSGTYVQYVQEIYLLLKIFTTLATPQL